MFRGSRQGKKFKIVKISGGTAGSGGGGGVNSGGGVGEGPRVKTLSARKVATINKNYSAAPVVPSGFRTIPLGDINLQREIWQDDEGVIRLRRLYSAKIEGSDATRTVAMYQGDGAEQVWRRDIAKYMALRHPNIVQLFGIASCGNTHAAIFHDDFIPIQQFVSSDE
ncbi:hypothetical protein MSAN_00314300 [Mycena sanguinolenta]|uniref:Protein kinase domain-containing protein n=1 Tax=Mycena sanguinolenta TaxID=230812 RepID=A0A8H6Z857_9AGAR|nr:hypothetical protein MSAN_00314300 [Mycena sanguinolenta]